MLFNYDVLKDIKKNFSVPQDLATMFDKATVDAFDAKGHSKMLAACFLSFLVREPAEQKALTKIAAAYRTGGGSFTEALSDAMDRCGVDETTRRAVIDAADAPARDLADSAESPHKRGSRPKKRAGSK